MKTNPSNETTEDTITSAPFRAVKDRAGRKVRGLWIRNNSYYLQTTILDGQTGLKKITKLRLSLATDIDTAKLEALKLKDQIKQGGTVQGKSGPTFKEYREHYLKNNVKKPNTFRNETYVLKQWEDYFGSDTKIRKITKQNILAYRVKMLNEGCSATTINLHIIILRNLFKLAVIEGHLRKPLATDEVINLKVIHNTKQLLTKEQIENVCDNSGSAIFNDYIHLMAYSGGRMTEVLKLKWNDIDFENKVLVFRGENTKNGQTRRLDFNSALETLLKGMMTRKTNSDYVFLSKTTEHPTRSFDHRLQLIRKKLNIPHLTNHLLRHYFISTCVMAGIDYMTIAEWVGHKDGGVLIGKTYGHLNREHKELMATKLNF